MAKAMKSSSGRRPRAWRFASAILARACCFCMATFTFICNKELAPGRVFLNISSASSSLRIFIVSANATCSSARSFISASCSSFFVAQFVSKSFRNLVSSSNAFSVSFKSSFICTISTPKSPTRTVFVSIAVVRLLISFSLAAINSSYDLIAASSVAFAAAKPLSIVSSICLSIPTISPLAGAYRSVCDPDRKDTSSSRS
mmetsp:Transcript_153496/g.286132  ORF Transcript_153496/g.286132 Transcript_153496/m.286132 type:complete len:200 (-) Transcript_153496:622-1221(-)